MHIAAGLVNLLRTVQETGRPTTYNSRSLIGFALALLGLLALGVLL
jgi:hypothetical protein